MLQDTFLVQRSGDDNFELRTRGTLRAHLRAPESILSQYAKAHAEDDLLALGQVGDDSSGTTTALGLMSVHIEETIATANYSPGVLEVTQGGLSRRGQKSSDTS